jgi:hypothetical protein
MMGKLGRDDETICNAIDYVLKFSELFFKAFSIEEERAKQWQFLSFILDKETDFKVLLKDLFDPVNNRAFLRFLDEVGPKSRDYVFSKILVAGFNTENTVLMQLEAGKKKNRALHLTPEFVKAARIYVDSFVSLMTEGKFKWNTTKPKDVMTYFKAIIGHQNKHYYPSWLEFVDAVSKKHIATELSPNEVHQKLKNGAPCWPMLLTSWQYHLGRRNVRVNTSGLYSAVFHAMKGSNVNEIADCLSFLAKEGGPKLLIAKKVDGEEWFLPNSNAYKAQFVSYTAKLNGLHAEMLNTLRMIS